ncbi:hypothetical protein [methane-oxidizing endosymbiont of Gigantopelta aegis]|uniref:hypothetical protein n=1 Tax=methane-oxidizing endosymbiont of Gigantopelta aegis TaxID=2794938 RepID=UPI0018DD0EFC|nr:hypothetical protein [methane-oxidizing endosymbiont of Gigantopelta aegis]
MSLLKKLTFILLTASIFTAAPSIMAKPAGKIENQTEEQLLAIFDDAIESVETVQQALENGAADKKEMLALYKKAKQNLNRIESATVNREKERANGYLRKSRSAYKKGNMEKAKEQIAKAVESFKGLKTLYLNF